MCTDALTTEKLCAAAQQLRRDVVEMVGPERAGCFPDAFSAADLLAALYFEKLHYDAKVPQWEGRDRFLLSKGSVTPLLYAALAQAGFFPKEELSTWRQLDSRLQGTPDMRLLPGVEATTGSPGQGLSIGLGLSLGMRLDQKLSRVYVLLGRDELAEGQVWEAAMAAADYRLDNLVAIVDCGCAAGDLAAKWTAFGWHVIGIDGHDFPAILAAYEEAEAVKDRPTVILASTVPGRGLPDAERS